QDRAMDAVAVEVVDTHLLDVGARRGLVVLPEVVPGRPLGDARVGQPAHADAEVLDHVAVDGRQVGIEVLDRSVGLVDVAVDDAPLRAAHHLIAPSVSPFMNQRWTRTRTTKAGKNNSM